MSKPKKPKPKKKPRVVEVKDITVLKYCKHCGLGNEKFAKDMGALIDKRVNAVFTEIL